MTKYIDFKPLIKSGYIQTILSTMDHFQKEIKSRTHYVPLDDGDVLALEISTPKAWDPNHGTAILVHGLCGSHKSNYMKRLSKKLFKKKMQVIRVNLRGCGSGVGLAKGIYHGGSSDDVYEVLKNLQKYFPETPTIIIGFSLGANILLKMLGEMKDQAKSFMQGAIAVSPPADLLASVRMFDKPENLIYAKYFMRILMQEISYRHKHFEDLPILSLPKNLSLYDFDHLYVAPHAHFSSALDYYYHCSAKRIVSDISIDTRILFAQDDPLVSSECLDDVSLPDHVEIYKTQYGGHIGYFGWNIFKDFYWMDNTVVKWVDEMLPRCKS